MDILFNPSGTHKYTGWLRIHCLHFLYTLVYEFLTGNSTDTGKIFSYILYLYSSIQSSIFLITHSRIYSFMKDGPSGVISRAILFRYSWLVGHQFTVCKTLTISSTPPTSHHIIMTDVNVRRVWRWDEMNCFGRICSLPFIPIKPIRSWNWMILDMTAIQCWIQ